MLKDILCAVLAATPLGVSLSALIYWSLRHGLRSTLQWVLGEPVDAPWEGGRR